MTGGRGEQPREPAWHERTSTLLGASVGALAVLGILYFLVSSFVGGSDDPNPAGQYFLEPSATSSRFSTPRSNSYSTSTTTQTITSTSPPATTDIDDPNAPTTSTTSGTSGTDTTSTSTSRSTTSRSSDDGSTTRQRPRFNETRTLYPRP